MSMSVRVELTDAAAHRNVTTTTDLTAALARQATKLRGKTALVTRLLHLLTFNAAHPPSAPTNNQSINQSNNQSVNQSVSQSVSQSSN